jgi:hypothetical protein
MMNFQVLVITMLICGGFCFHDPKHLAFLFNSTLNILDFDVEDFAMTSLQEGPNLNFWKLWKLFHTNVIYVLFTLSINVACMCRSTMSCSGQDQIGPG